MTILNCTAVTCVYNKDQLCSRGEIEVMGHGAQAADETSCGSFRDRNDASVTNSTKDSCGCEKISIDCKAHDCTYNEHCKCTAAAIDIDGPNANASKETKCSTFECKC